MDSWAQGRLYINISQMNTDKRRNAGKPAVGHHRSPLSQGHRPEVRQWQQSRVQHRLSSQPRDTLSPQTQESLFSQQSLGHCPGPRPRTRPDVGQGTERPQVGRWPLWLQPHAHTGTTYAAPITLAQLPTPLHTVTLTLCLRYQSLLEDREVRRNKPGKSTCP